MLIGLASPVTARFRGAARWWVAGAFGLDGTMFFFVYTNFGFWVLYQQYDAPRPPDPPRRTWRGCPSCGRS